MRHAALLTALLLVACRKSEPARPADPQVPGLAPSRATGGATPKLPIDQLRLPPGFTVQVYASEVKNARSMALSPKGTLFVGSKDAGVVHAIPDADGDQRGDRVITLAKDLDTPNGVVFRQGALYVAERSRILRYDAIEDHLDDPPKPVVVFDQFPDDAHHGWKFMALGHDDKLYVPVGAPCNVCDEKNPVYASITRLDVDGTHFEIVARGIRNTVGFDWHPLSKQLWFTENGRDRMGDDAPADELNRLSQVGQHFGFPYCHAGSIPDPEFARQGPPCAGLTAPVRLLGPHVAALGMRFYTGPMFPAEYKGRIFVAEHGSWNRSKKIGYRVMAITLNGHQAPTYEVFAEGWLQGERAWGRPVDVQQTRDGALLVSDDEANAIYRIAYAAP